MPYTILLVDDNPAIRNSLRAFIQARTNWTICGEAENGQIALDKVRELHPDVVILDFYMPVMNGLETAKHLAREAPGVAKLLITLHSSEQLQREAEAVGIKAVLSKAEGLGNNLIAAIETACASLKPSTFSTETQPGLVPNENQT
jgi:DNA-binding NarL/FixJ family response regulator